MKKLTKTEKKKLDEAFNYLKEDDYVNVLLYLAEKLNGLMQPNQSNNYTRASGRLEDSKKVDRDIKELIGTIPYLFVSKEHFSSNRELADFAFDLGIELPFWEKRSRSEIIGTVIIGLSNMNRKKIKRLNNVINKIITDKKAQNKEGFFSQWESAIKELEF